MSKAPEARLGGSFGAIKAHEFFDDFDWDNFFLKKIEPPYIPRPEEIHNKTLLQKQQMSPEKQGSKNQYSKTNKTDNSA